MIRQAAMAALLLPGLGGTHARLRVDPSRAPWAAVVRVQVAGVSRCTGFAVAANRIVTAAHCLYARRLARMVPPQAVHVLSLYSGGDYARHETAQTYRLATGGPGGPAPLGQDFAVLTLAAPVTALVLKLTAARPGQRAMLGGYSQDVSEVISADTACHVLGPIGPPGGELLEHDCVGTHGTSGAPLLVQADGGAWEAAGVQVGAAEGAPGGVAVPAQAVLAALAGS